MKEGAVLHRTVYMRNEQRSKSNYVMRVEVLEERFIVAFRLNHNMHRACLFTFASLALC